MANSECKSGDRYVAFYSKPDVRLYLNSCNNVFQTKQWWWWSTTSVVLEQNEETEKIEIIDGMALFNSCHKSNIVTCCSLNVHKSQVILAKSQQLKWNLYYFQFLQGN